MVKTWCGVGLLAVLAGSAGAAGARSDARPDAAIVQEPAAQEPAAQEPAAQEPAAPAQAAPAQAELVALFAEQGVRLDLARREIALSAKICVLHEPLEYALVIQPQGKDHESLLSCEGVAAEALNAAMLMLGVEKGRNGTIRAADPAPTLEEIQNGAEPSVVEPAAGDGFYVYVSWEEAIAGRTEPFVYRLEDLIINARTEGTYQRGKWVYLGSRFVKPHKDAAELFAAQGEGNLVSLCIFEPANHLLTGADPDSDDEQIWYPNVFLLPPVGHPVTITFAREARSGALQ
jgi:hypothetical protein